MNPTPSSFWPQQSPIALVHDRALHVGFAKDFLRIEYRDAPYSGHFVGEVGHRNWELQCDRLGRKAPPTIELGGVLAQLVKIHVHMPSEHDLEGQDQDGEIHLIHRIVTPTTGSTLIVLGVFFSAEANATTCVPGEFCAAWARQKCVGAEGTEEEPMNPNLLLSDPSRWYRYEGSLTTHPYDEVVSWLVFAAPLKIASKDLAVLKVDAAQPERKTQELHRRFVVRNF